LIVEIQSEFGGLQGIVHIRRGDEKPTPKNPLEGGGHGWW
jgi:hypothetical protein